MGSFVAEKLGYASFRIFFKKKSGFFASWHGLVSSYWLARGSFGYLIECGVVCNREAGLRAFIFAFLDFFQENWRFWSGWHVARVQLLVGSWVIFDSWVIFS